MREWVSTKDRKPLPSDSPILAVDSLDHFSTAALHYLEQGWDGPGWYDHSDEYGLGLNENEAHYQDYSGILFWMPLPAPPEGK